MVCSRSAAVFEACDSWRSASSPGASARTPSMSACNVGAGGIRQLYIDAPAFVNHRLTTKAHPGSPRMPFGSCSRSAVPPIRRSVE